MIYLYRFDVLNTNGALTSRLGPDLLQAASGGTQHLHTNQEQAVLVDSPTLFGSALMPSASAGPWTFTPIAISHSGIRLDAERAAGQITVTLPAEHPVAQLYVADSPSARVSLSLAARYDTAPGQPIAVLWSGLVVGAEHDEHRCTLTLEHVGKLIGGQGLTERHPLLCPHALYDKATCKVKQHAFDAGSGYFRYREDALLDLSAGGLSFSSDRSRLLVPEALNRPTGFFTGGYAVIEPVYSGAGESFFLRGAGTLSAEDAAACVVTGGVRRGIALHYGPALTLASSLPAGVLEGATQLRVSLYAGCAKTPEACQTLNPQPRRFGGHRYIPLKNLYETGLQ